MRMSCATGLGGGADSAGFAAAGAGAGVRAAGLAGVFGGAFVCGAAGFAGACASSGATLDATHARSNADRNVKDEMKRVIQLTSQVKYARLLEKGLRPAR